MCVNADICILSRVDHEADNQSDMADEYPNARVTGVDLSPIQPSFVPPNCTFEIDDMTMPWTYAPERFDFIHVRELFGSIPDWDEFFRQCYRALKPGGYIEVVEHSVSPVVDDATMGPDHFYRTWGKTVIQAGERFGKSFSIWEESADRLKKAGFVEVLENSYKWPMNGYVLRLQKMDLEETKELTLAVGGAMIRNCMSWDGGTKFGSMEGSKDLCFDS